MNKKVGFHYAWVIMLCGCAIVGVNLGVFSYTIGNFYLPVSLELGVGVGSIALYQTMAAFASAFTFPIARRLLIKYNLRVVLTCSTISTILAYAVMSRITALWQVYACAIWIGFSIAFYSGVTVPLMINNWFRKNNGAVYGVCLAAGAVVGVFANPLLSKIISEYSWRAGYLAIAAITAFVMLPVSIFFVRMRPEEKGVRPYGAEDVPLDAEIKSTEHKSGVPASVAFKSSAFYAVLICTPCLGIVFNVTNHITTYATVIGIGSSVGAYLTSISLIGGTLGKLTLGRFSDKYGIKFSLTLAEACAIGGILMVVLSTWAGSWLLFPGVFIFGYGASTTSLMGALIPKAVFGERDYAQILSYTSMAMSVGVGLISPIYGFIYDISGSYLPSFGFAICIGVLCLASAYYSIIHGEKLMKKYS
ncbi:MAG: MFS transporter [Clostridiaceae bacterium]|nr:MFS transporter [Clostridiaceae bacterium]